MSMKYNDIPACFWGKGGNMPKIRKNLSKMQKYNDFLCDIN